MCYDVVVRASRQAIAEAFNVTLSLDRLDAWEPRDHVGLGQYLPAVTQSAAGRGAELMYWGFTPAWMKDPKGGMKPGNARSETIATTPMFRSAFKSHRCIVPATAFCEWIGEKGSKQLLPFTVDGREILALPGVWDEWTMPDGKPRLSLAIVTTDPNSDIRPYHDRMPVVLDRDEADLWLTPGAATSDLQKLLMPLGDGQVIAHPESVFNPRRR